MRRPAFASALLLLAVMPAEAQSPKPPCVMISQVYDFKALPGNRALIVVDRFRKTFKLSFTSACNDIQSDRTLGFKTFEPGRLACLSRGDFVISKTFGSSADRCRIDKIESYTPEMARADAAVAAEAKQH